MKKGNGRPDGGKASGASRENVDSEDTGSGAAVRQDPIVEARRPNPGTPAVRALTLSGFAGRSDRPGYRRLYLTVDLDRYLEFRAEDVIDEEVHEQDRPQEGSGGEITLLRLRYDATIDHVCSGPASAVDDFDLDLQRAPAVGGTATGQNITWFAGCTWGTDCGGGETGFGLTCPCPRDTYQITLCRGRTCLEVCETVGNRFTCLTCPTECNQATCQTCATQCGQPTCGATCRTCLTACQQATCQTCETACNQATCRTCLTDCRTCVTCETCNSHVFTCRTGCR